MEAPFRTSHNRAFPFPAESALPEGEIALRSNRPPMQWVFDLYREHLTKKLRYLGMKSPTEDELREAFAATLRESTAKLLVQEPWMQTIRFKLLALFAADEMRPLLERPLEFIRETFGGGKFKVNFYEGMNFVATKNFKPEGPPLWADLPELEEG